MAAGTNGTWNTKNFTLPGTVGSNLQIRFRQLSNSGSCCDHWAIDEFSVTGGGSPLTFAWAPAAGVANPTKLITKALPLAGTTTYTITANSPNGCNTTATMAVTATPKPSAAFVASRLCANGVRFVVQNPTVGATQHLYFGDGQDTLGTGTSTTHAYAAPGTYAVKLVTTLNGCADSTTQNITVMPALVANATKTNVQCFGLANGSATAAATGGTAPYAFLWYNQTATLIGSGASIGSLNTGRYYLVATDATGCVAKDSFNINQPLPLTITHTITQPTCASFTNGSILIAHNGGTGPFTYLWSNLSTNKNQSNLAPGTYTLTVTDARGCTANDTSVLAAPLLPPLSISAATATTFCTGGSVQLSVQTGYTSYQWTLNGVNIPGATLSTYTATATGSYAAIGTLNGCTNTTASQTVTVLPALAPPTVGLSGLSAICPGNTLTLNAGSGYASYLWKLNGTAIAGATSQTLAVSTAGSYTVTVTAGAGCTATSAPVLTTIAPVPVATITVAGSSTACAGTPVQLNGTPGQTTYQWNLNGTAITGATTASYNATQTGAYTLTVSNASLCTATSAATTVTINPAAPVPTVLAGGPLTFCAGGNVVLTAPAGYTYIWSLNGTPIPGATAATYTATATGNYSVTIATAAGCSATSQPTAVLANPLPTVAITATGATSVCPPLNVTLNATAGLATYQWYRNAALIAGATNATYVATQAGAYTVVGGTAAGCTATSAALNLTALPLPSFAISSTGTAICAGASLLLTAPAGFSSYAWRLNGAPIAGATSATYAATLAGTYTATATNASGCTAPSTNTITLTISPLPVVAITAPGTSLCAGASLLLTATPGLATYQWTLNGANIAGATAATYAATTAGNYAVAVSAAGGCTATSATYAVTVTPLPVVAITGNSGVCVGTTTVLTATPGLATYQWLLNGANISGATSATYTATVAGTYTVAATAASGCAATSPAFVLNSLALPSATITPSGPTTFCVGGNVVLSAPAGLSYVWSTTATTRTITVSTPGMYSVTVTNGAGCTATSSVSVSVNALPVLAITATTPTTFCAGGTVLLTATAGLANYQWTLNGTNIAGATSATYSANATGNYAVQATNATGCTGTATAISVTVNALPATPVVLASGPLALCAGASVTLTGPVAASYQWNVNGAPLALATNATLNVSTAGTYTLTVSNGAGCSATSANQVITVNPLPVVAITGTNTICPGATTTLSATAGLSAYQWKLNGIAIAGATSATYSTNVTGTYTVTASSASGCVGTSPAFVLTNSPLPSVSITATTPTTFCIGDSVTLSANAGLASYQWSRNGTAIAGATSASYTTKTAGSYTVTGTNGAGCSATSTATSIIVNPLPTVAITTAANSFCAGASLTLSATPGLTTYQWSLNGLAIAGATNATYTATTAGTYTVTGTNATACSATSSGKAITINPLPVVAISGINNVCPGSTTVLSATAGLAGYQWSLNGAPIAGATTATYSTGNPGTYTVTASSASGCVGTSPAFILGNFPTPVVSVVANSSTSICLGDSVTLAASAGFATYQWALNGTTIAGATLPNFNAKQAGTYTVTVSNVTGCTATSTSTSVSIKPQPVVGITSTGTSFCAGNSLLLSATAGLGLVSVEPERHCSCRRHRLHL